MANPKIKVVFFDFMGTCLDWHSGAIRALPQSIPESMRSKLALEWRHDYFDSNAARLAAGQPPEDIDITLRSVLDALLEKHPEHKPLFDEPVKQRCVAAWHSMPAWPEVARAVEQLKAAGLEVFVFANGTTRLQLDLCRSSGLSFHMLFSSQLLGVYKPAPESYQKAVELVQARPDECAMVAAHAYDTRGAKKAGMHTVYIHRWTDDINEDMGAIRADHDFFLEDMNNLVEVIKSIGP
jgi:2-haloalkanoic acid dehalogenase type II